MPGTGVVAPALPHAALTAGGSDILLACALVRDQVDATDIAKLPLLGNILHPEP